MLLVRGPSSFALSLLTDLVTRTGMCTHTSIFSSSTHISVRQPSSMTLHDTSSLTCTPGTALTFSQMLFVTLHSLPSFLVWYRPKWLPKAVPISIPTPSLKTRQVPLSQWALQVLVLTTGSLLNNWAFGFQVPLTVQIIFRSAGAS